MLIFLQRSHDEAQEIRINCHGFRRELTNFERNYEISHTRRIRLPLFTFCLRRPSRKTFDMSNAMRKIEELTALWRTQAESYKEEPEAGHMISLGIAAAATVNACASELEKILNDN